MNAPTFLFTCEHSSHRVPRELAALFRGREKALRSHRGWDEGAAPIAGRLATAFGAPVIHGKYSRLVVDLNRTEDHPRIFSEWTRGMENSFREELIRAIHRKHWDKVRSEIGRLVRSGRPMIHVGVHSFVPVLYGQRRRTDIGLLFDPARKPEVEFCRKVKRSLQKDLDLAVHFNLPYRGTGNGLVTALREEFPVKHYLGIELEINRRLLPKRSAEISRAFIRAFGA